MVSDYLPAQAIPLSTSLEETTDWQPVVYPVRFFRKYGWCLH